MGGNHLKRVDRKFKLISQTTNVKSREERDFNCLIIVHTNYFCNSFILIFKTMLIIPSLVEYQIWKIYDNNNDININNNDNNNNK